MKICTVSRVMPSHLKGGMQDHVFDLARGLALRGHRVRVLSTSHPDGRRQEEPVSGFTVHYLPDTESMKGGPRFERAAAAELARLAREGEVDVVHSQGHAGLFLVGKDGRPPGPPCAISLHGTHWDELVTGWNLMRWARPWKERRKGYKRLRRFLRAHRRDRDAIARFDGVIATSREQAELIARRYRVPRERLHLVLNGIDANAYASLPPYDGAPVVLCLARLVCEKGVQFALDAVARLRASHPGLRLRIVGDGPYRERLAGVVRRHGLTEGVSFEGEVEPTALPEAYRSCSIFANPTIRQNGYDLTILQAMAAGRPVVVSNVGSVPTAVEDGVNGLLVPPGSPRALASALDRLIRDPDLGRRLAETARKDVQARFSLEAMAAAAEKVFLELAGESRTSHEN